MSVSGKNIGSDEIYLTSDYIKDNPALFANSLYLLDKDRDSFLSYEAEKCANRALYVNLAKLNGNSSEKNENEDINEITKNICSFWKTLFYVTGRNVGKNYLQVDQKTFNQINYVYYILVPHSSKKKSSISYFSV